MRIGDATKEDLARLINAVETREISYASLQWLFYFVSGEANYWGSVSGLAGWVERMPPRREAPA